jgi:hypothetical protein
MGSCELFCLGWLEPQSSGITGMTGTYQCTQVLVKTGGLKLFARADLEAPSSDLYLPSS